MFPLNPGKTRDLLWHPLPAFWRTCCSIPVYYTRSRGQDVNLCAVKRSRSRLRCSQAVKQPKRQSKFLDPGRSRDYCAYESDHPLTGFNSHDIDHREIFECAHLKFTVSSRSGIHFVHRFWGQARALWLRNALLECKCKRETWRVRNTEKQGEGEIYVKLV